MYIKIKLFGTAFHPMLVAYPVVLYTATVVAFLIYQVGGELFWFRLGHVANKAGVMMALVTLGPGVAGWLFGLRRGTSPDAADRWYLLLNLLALGLFTATALMNAGEWDTARPDIGLPLLLVLVGVGLTIAGGFYGWTFVQNRPADDATLWQWQVRAARLAEELEQARQELGQTQAELQQLRAERLSRAGAGAEPEQSPSWSARANQTWSAMADQSWFATRETHSSPAKLVLVIALTVAAVAFISVAPNLVGLR